MNEPATNAVKSAFPAGEGRIIRAFVRRDGDVPLSVSDDGIGLSGAGVGNGVSGLGSRFVEAFVRQLGGARATASNGQGTTFTARLPTTILAEPPPAS